MTGQPLVRLFFLILKVGTVDYSNFSLNSLKNLFIDS